MAKITRANKEWREENSAKMHKDAKSLGDDESQDPVMLRKYEELQKASGGSGRK